MIKVENIEVFNFEGAIRGMRNPMCSHNRSDSVLGGNGGFQIGENDLNLMQRLYKAGHQHRKYLRQIMVSMDITAPLYWWVEMDTHKVATTANFCSKMHTIHKTSIDETLFSFDGGIELDAYETEVIDRYLHLLEEMRRASNPGSKKWRTLIQLLPESFNQKRTVTMSYENVFNILQYRQGHKLNEWNEFCEILKGLPYALEIMGEKNEV